MLILPSVAIYLFDFQSELGLSGTAGLCMQRYNTFARVFSHKVSHIDVLAVIVWSTQWGQTQFGSLIL